jgi:hypothetical protein
VPTLKRVISADTESCDLTVINNRIFALCRKKRRIEEYDENSFAKLGNIFMKNLSGNKSWCGLTSCVVNNCLYVSDGEKDTVSRVDLSDDNKVFTWRVSHTPGGLSVNNEHNLLVACLEAGRIQEYTTRGSLVREIFVRTSEDGLHAPFHAVQLTTGQYVISYMTKFVDLLGDPDAMFPSAYDVGETNAKGRVAVSYSSTTQHQFKFPVRVAVDKNNETVFVADCINHRILMIDRSTNSVRELNLSLYGGVVMPTCLHYDEQRGRLYFGDLLTERIFALDNLVVIAGAVAE